MVTDILSIALRLYAIGGAVIVIASVAIFSVSLLVYKVVAWLLSLLKVLLGYIATHEHVSLRSRYHF